MLRSTLTRSHRSRYSLSTDGVAIAGSAQLQLLGSATENDFDINGLGIVGGEFDWTVDGSAGSASNVEYNDGGRW